MGLYVGPNNPPCPSRGDFTCYHQPATAVLRAHTRQLSRGCLPCVFYACLCVHFMSGISSDVFAKILPDELFTRNQRTCASQPPLVLAACIYDAGGARFPYCHRAGKYSCTVGGWFFNTCEMKLKCPPVLLSKPFLIPHPREANKQFRNLRTFSKDDNQITKY